MPQGRSKWIAVLALGLVAGVLVGSSAATGAITLPSTSVPGVQVPSTQLPGAQLPGVTVPTTQLPSVQTPSTQAPGVRLPTPRLPSVSLPTTSPSTSTPGTKSQDGPTRLPSVQTLTNDTKLPTGSGPAQSPQTSSAIPGGSSGSGGSGGPGGNPGAGSSGAGGLGNAGPGAVGGNGPNGLGGGASGLGGLRGSSLLAATTAQLRSAIAPLRGCFYGLSRPERSVLNLRTGLTGRVPQTRRQVARRLGTSPRQVFRTEEQAIQKLNGLAQTDGCGTATSFGGVMVVNGIIGPAEIAASPSLVAFGNPAYQGLEQSSFSRRGPGLGLGSVAPLPANFGAGSTNGSTWAFQLLAIMLLVALGGFYKFIPVVAARLRRRTHPRGTPFDFESIGQMSEPELDRARDGELPSEREREKIAA